MTQDSSSDVVGDAKTRFDELADEIDALRDDLDMPGTARHLERAREALVDAHRMHDWERQG